MLTSIENLSHVANGTSGTNNGANNSGTNHHLLHLHPLHSNTNTIKAPSANAELSNVAAAAAIAAAAASGAGAGPAKAVLICHPNSHAFVDRTLVLDKPIKIGRSVGHNKASPSNGIFDCKVLSRNHALLWYEEQSGRFLLRDTRSSNGTFVNTERLSKSSEESAPREVFSGDTVQFGVDVVENSRNVTHGCVIATLKLFLPNGREAKPAAATAGGLHSALAGTGGSYNGGGGRVTLEDLYHLNQYLQESLQREQMLEQKLEALQTLMRTLRESTELGWKALISNNSLLSRVELLEVQLKCYSKKFAEDKLREELRVLQEDKNAYESVVKQYFQKILDEKIEATQQCQDMERALANAKLELGNAQLLLSSCRTELRELALKNAMQEKMMDELEARLRLSAEKSEETIAKITEENTAMYDQIKSLTGAEEVLQQTIKELETHGDYAHKQVMSLQSQVEELQKHHSDILCELVDPALIKDKINDVELVRSWITIYKEALRKCKENTVVVRKRAEQLRGEKMSMQQKMTLLECEQNNCAIELQDYREEEAVLEAKIMERKSELDAYKPVPDILDELNEKKCTANENDVADMQEQHKLLNVIQRDISSREMHYEKLDSLLKTEKDELVKVTVSLAIEEDKLDLYEKQLANLETAVRTLNEHVENLDTYQKETVSIEDVQSLKKQLSEAHEMAQEKQTVTIGLMRHFAQFVSLVNAKLDAVEATVADTATASVTATAAILDENMGALDELKLLKLEGCRLVEAVAELHRVLDSVSSGSLASGDSDLLAEVDGCCQPLAEQQLNDDLIVILKEKLRCLQADNELLERSLASLQQQYDYLKSYPYFDLYFILPVVLLILLFIFNFGDKLSFVLGTWG